MNDLDNELSRTMRRHAENLSVAPLAFDDVRGRATSIRRRRRLATSVGIAAAVAVIVPTAMFATQNVRADDIQPPANSGTPTVIDSNGTEDTEGPGPTRGADAGPLDVSDLPTGAGPGLSLVAHGLALVEIDGAEVRWKGGVVVEVDGQSYGPYPSAQWPVRNPAATAVAWANDEGQVMAWATGASEPFVVIEDMPGVSVGAVSGTSCAPSDDPGDCLFYVSGLDAASSTGDSAVFTVTPQGNVADANLPISVSDATDDGRVLGLTSMDHSGSTCSAVFDPAGTGSTPLWETCDHTLDMFSRNGDYVLASDTNSQLYASRVIAIYDAADGQLLAERRNESGGQIFYTDANWEDETHVLLTVFQDGQWSIVRMDVNGTMEYAVEPQQGDQWEPPWRFETT